MSKRIAVAAAAALVAITSLPSPSEAHWRRHHHRGPVLAAAAATAAVVDDCFLTRMLTRMRTLMSDCRR